MEWVGGGTVREWVQGRSISVVGGGEEGELVGLLRKVGEAVGRLHSKGVVHGDLTTSNMMVRPPLYLCSS